MASYSQPETLLAPSSLAQASPQGTVPLTPLAPSPLELSHRVAHDLATDASFQGGIRRSALAQPELLQATTLIISSDDIYMRKAEQV